MLFHSIDWYLFIIFMHDRRKVQSIQIANIVHLHSNLSSNSLQFREGSHCLKRISFGLNKCNDMVYSRNSQMHISVMKFSTASYNMLEVTNQTRQEEELSSLSSYDNQVRLMKCLGSRGYRLPKTPSRRKLSGDETGWAEASYKLTQIRMEMHALDKSSSYPSNTNTIAFSNSKKPTISENEGHNFMLQDLHEPDSSSVQHSILNSKVLPDTERVDTESNDSSLEFSEEKIDRVNGNHSLATTAKDKTQAKSAVAMIRSDEQLKLRDRLCSIYEDILVVNNLSHAEEVAKMLTVNYRHLIHACDTEV